MIFIPNSNLKKILKFLIPFVFIPIATIGGTLIFDEKRHLFLSLAVAIMTVVLFLCGFEKKEIGTRRTVIVSVMIALSIVGRFLPFFKPVTALTIIAAIHLGSEAGFMVGSFSALLSNFYFGQGPWTPFQMLAWGILGWIAGAIAKPLKKSRYLLFLFGILSGAAYSMMMDLWTVLWAAGSSDAPLFSTAIITALPHTLLYSFSNFIFLYFLSKPFGDKLQRIKIKYGI